MNRESNPPPGSGLRNLRGWLAISLLLVAAGLPAPAQTPSLVGSWPGYNRRDLTGVAVSGHHVYAAGWHGGLQIIDVSDPAAPVPVSGFNPNVDQAYPGATADQVAVSGNHAYVVFGPFAGRKGMQVVDVSDPRQPVGRGRVFTSRACVDVAVEGGRAFMAAETAGVLMADVRDPGKPVELGIYNTTGTARAVAVVGSLVYVADGSAGLQILDVSTPGTPELVGGLNTTGDATDVAVSGGYAFVADDRGGLVVIDVSRPSAPVRVGSLPTRGGAVGVAVSGTRAYVADGSAGLLVVDISTPESPVELGEIAPPTHEEPRVPPTEIKARSVAVAGNRVFVGFLNAGIDIIDVTDPAAPVREGYHGVGVTSSVAESGGLLYVADRYWLQILDLTQPAAPRRVGGLLTNALSVQVAFNHAYVRLYDVDSGLLVVDVSDPAHPRPVGRYGEGSRVGPLTFLGHHAVAPADDQGLEVLDLSEPASPKRVGAYQPGEQVSGPLVLSGDLAFASVRDGFHVIDLHDRTAPVPVGRLTLGSYPHLVGMVGPGLLAVFQNTGPSGYTSTLHIVDMSDPANPRKVKAQGFSQGVFDATVAGNFVVATFRDYGGVRWIDVSDPLAPLIKGTVTRLTPLVEGSDLAVSGEHVYLAGGYGGVGVVRIPALVTRPALEVGRSGGSVVVSWPASASGFGLESAPAGLPGSPWAPWSGPTEVVGDRVRATVTVDPGAGGPALYRLRKP